MKIIPTLTPIKVYSCLLLFAAWISTTAYAQGTAFTYQGRLNANGGPANGTYDFEFQLAADPSGINHVGNPYSTNGIVVTNGLFVAAMDFGPGILNGSNYWLIVYVRTNNAGVYTSLTPPQPLTPAPYAVFANSSSNLLGVLPAGQLSGTVANGNLPVSPTFSAVTATTFAGSGVNLSNVNALSLNGLSSTNFWQLGGNNVGGGQFFGSTNNQPVEIWANGARVLRIEPGVPGYGSPNIVGGAAINFIAPGVAAATIGGGGATNYFGISYTNYVTADMGTIGGGMGNAATNTEATVGGGAINAAGGNAATVGGGQNNNATGGEATIGGGNVNTSSGDTSVVAGGGFNNATGSRSAVGGGVGNSATNSYGTVAGGGNNLAGGQYSTVAGGFNNTNYGDYSAIPGGLANLTSGTYSFAAGQQAQATNDGAFVWADSQSSPFASTNNDSFNVRARGGVRFVTGGAGVTVDGFPALASGGGSGITIQNNSSGAPNVIEGSPANFVSSGVVAATIGGGGAVSYQGVPYTNSVTGDYGTVSGGLQNTAASGDSIGGGYDNLASATYAVVGGGYGNTNSGDYATIAGGVQNSTIASGVSTIGGGYENLILGLGGDFFDTIGGGQGNVESNTVYSFIGGGVSNLDFTSYSVIGGGALNTLGVLSRYSVMGGGQGNLIGTNSDHSVIGGGLYNSIGTNSSVSTISGGASNSISSGNFFGTIGGGTNNFVGNVSGTVAGGENNSAINFRDTVGGGSINTASGGISTVAGGWVNVASGNSSVISGGDHNVASGLGAAVLAGESSQATNTFATTVGGQNNIAGGAYSLAAGQQAQALHGGAFVWSDTSGGAFTSVTNNEFAVRANGGVRIVADKGIHLNANDRPIIVRDFDVFPTNAPSYKAGIGRWGLFMEPSMLTIGIPSNDVSPRFFQVAKYSTNGNYTTLVLVDQNGNLYATNNVFAKGVQLTSDRNAKEHFTPLNPAGVLAKVAAMSVTEWNYKDDNADDKHIGPVAQDFHKAFGLNGDDDKHISAVDESGVALAAIQGLNQEVGELKSENAELKQRLAALEKLIRERK